MATPAAGSDSDSALKSLLRHADVHDKAVIPTDLLQFGLYGSLIVIATGMFALALPSAHTMSHGGFVLLFKGAVGGLTSFVGALAVPALLFGFALLGLDLYLMQVPTKAHSRVAIVAQAAAGGVSATVCAIFVALLLVNLLIWLLIIGAVIGALIALIAGAGN
jgi:hypothetical protein